MTLSPPPIPQNAPPSAAAADLLSLSALLHSTIQTVISEWAKAPISTPHSPSPPLPSRPLYEAQRTIQSIAGKLIELVSSPSERILEVASQYWESRALHILVERRVADLLHDSSPSSTVGTERVDTGGIGTEDVGVGVGVGVHVAHLATKTGIERRKLSRLLRTLTSNHIFAEVAPDTYANNVSSAALVSNEPLRAWVLNHAFNVYPAAEFLPGHLLGPQGKGYGVEGTAWVDAMRARTGEGESKRVGFWEWIGEKVPRREIRKGEVWWAEGESGDGEEGKQGEDGEEGKQGEDGEEGKQGEDGEEGELVERPEARVFGLAMLGGGRVVGAAHVVDFPWGEIGGGIVVDVGGGVGGFDIQLSRLYPQLKFVVQDRGPNLEHAKQTIWPKEAPEALEQGRVTFMEHDFFQPNPVRDAEVYWLRYIIHDWSDEYCIKILRAIRASISSTKSRVLICDHVMNTTLGCEELEPAPAPLPANYGYHTRYSHQRDLTMMGVINGIERSPREFRELVEKAGFKIKRIWQCRSPVSIVELEIQEGGKSTS